MRFSLMPSGVEYADFKFKLSGGQIPADHGYYLFSALSTLLPSLRELSVAIHPIQGIYNGKGKLDLQRRSRLAIRSDSTLLGQWMGLIGQNININGNKITIKTPEVYKLKPASTLRSRLVTIKGYLDLEPFADAVRRKLDAMNVDHAVQIHLLKREIIRIRNKKVVGFAVCLEGLSAEESLDIQVTGIGGRQRMGCGVFTPWRS